MTAFFSNKNWEHDLEEVTRGHFPVSVLYKNYFQVLNRNMEIRCNHQKTCKTKINQYSTHNQDIYALPF